MEKAASHIIKGDNVQLDGAFQLNSNGPVPRPVRRPPKPLISTQAKIVELNNDFAIVEVTCSCGHKIPVKCTYANNAPSEGAN
ncbi:MAG: hypothetical protein ACYTE8_02260 [Planctomycetota bacterium]|jgi:hypothetical protein